MSRKEKILYLFLTSAWFIYLLLRVIYVPLVNDEAFTFFWYINRNEILPYQSLPDANNHFLNSLLALYSTKLLGVFAWSIRLPNLVSSIIFIYFIYKLSSLFKHIHTRWGFILTLLSSRLLSEYFGYCRGYGISMSMMAGMLWFLFCFLKTKNPFSFLISLVFMILAVSANLNLISTGVIFLLIVALFYVTNVHINLKEPWVYIMLFLFATGVYSLKYFMDYGIFLQENGKLYFGDGYGFYNGTIIGLIKILDHSSGKLIYAISGILFFLSVGIGLYKLIFERFRNFFTPSVILLTLLTANMAVTVLASKFFHMNYPQNRAVLHWFVIFIIYIFLIVDSLPQAFMRYVRVILMIIPAYFIVHSIPYLNLHYSYIYVNECFPNKFFDLVHLQKNKAGYPVSTAAYIFQNPEYMFKNFLEGGNDAGLSYNSFPSECADYQVIDTAESKQPLAKYDIIAHEKSSKLCLLKRKTLLTPEYFRSKSGINSGGNSNTESILLICLKTDSLLHYPVYVGFDLTLSSDIKPFVAAVVVDVLDSADNHLLFEKLDLDRYNSKYSHTLFKNGFLIPPIPSNAAKIKVFLWNYNLLPFKLEYSSCEIFKMVEK